MAYPSLGQIEPTPDQDLGLTVAFKQDLAQQRTTAKSPEEYLAQFVVAKLEDLAVAHVSGAQFDIIVAGLKVAFAADDVATVNAAAAAVHVDITINPNKP